ncbi:hypothetical protein KPL71_027066 [Citrus sinensis]|uniref:Uncharacterized protein n=1 Tax=Citrus sinensis TaxID=2711 RepID=A0ACB8I3T0_CITSI|nr:hypothetical protein KPL71_027066 [Citrus sinensis]
MAATAAAAIGSSFSSSMHTPKCMRAKQCPVSLDHNNNVVVPMMKLSAPRVLLASISQPCTIEPLNIIGAIPQQSKWRVLKMSAAVEQEEAAATAEEEASGLVEEETEEVQEDGEARAEAEAEPEAAALAPPPLGVNTKLYFGNLPYNVDSAQLAGIIQDYGSPELVEVLYDRETGRSRGFAFVTMSTVEDCNAVIENLDGRVRISLYPNTSVISSRHGCVCINMHLCVYIHFNSLILEEYLGRILRVNFSDKPKPKVPLYAETDFKLFVGNLSWSVTTESLTQAFQEYGNVVGARVLYDGESGRSRGYGFVCYSTKAEMETALESLNGVVLILSFLFFVLILRHI